MTGDSTFGVPHRAQPLPARRIRVSNDQRLLVVQRLSRGHADGCLTADEFEDRVRSAWAAVNRGDLDDLTDDLPEEPPEPPLPVPVDQSRHRPLLRALTSLWLVLSTTSMVVWLVIGAALGGLGNPGWIWVFGPPGAVLATLWLLTDRPHRADSRSASSGRAASRHRGTGDSYD